MNQRRQASRFLWLFLSVSVLTFFNFRFTDVSQWTDIDFSSQLGIEGSRSVSFSDAVDGLDLPGYDAAHSHTSSVSDGDRTYRRGVLGSILTGVSETDPANSATTNAIAPPFADVHDFRTNGARPRSVRTRPSRLELHRGGNSSAYWQRVHQTASLSGGSLDGDDAGDDAKNPFAARSWRDVVDVCEERRGDALSYAAAWLQPVEALLQNGRVNREHLYNATRKKNLEYGYFGPVLGVKSSYSSKDLFDFMAHHLSNYEKISRHRGGNGGHLENATTSMLEQMIVDYERLGYNNPSRVRADDVLVVLPDFATADGTVTHTTRRRQAYLDLTVKTLSLIFPNIVVFTASAWDFNYVTDPDGELNRFLYDVQLIDDMHRPVDLTYGTSVHTKTLFENGAYSQEDFKYVYYTEPDQILHVRNIWHVLEALDRKSLRRAVLVPHRGQPYPRPEDFDRHLPSGSSKLPYQLLRLVHDTRQLPLHQVPNIADASCCFPSPCRPKNRRFDSARNLTDGVPLFRQHSSFAYVAGTGNIFKEAYIPCNFSSTRLRCD